MISLTVLAPNGHRKNCKYSPNTTVMQIIDDVCQKYGYLPSEYDLKHHNTVLDPTLAVRFTDLPNNAQLELVPLVRCRQEAPVTIAINVEASGTRVVGTFPPDTVLMQILRQLCGKEHLGAHPVVIYARHELFGEALNTTTLRALGLISGRAMVRLVDCQPERLRTQANISGVLKARTPPPSENREIPKISVQLDSNFLLSPVLVAETMSEESPKEVLENDEHSCNEDIFNTANCEKQRMIAAPPDIAQKCSTIDMEQQVEFIGPREALLFSVDHNVAKSNSFATDLPDDFYELTIEDAKLLLKDARQLQHHMENTPMMTSALRHLEDSKRQLRQLQRYRKTIIRVRFPDSVILQATFSPVETVAEVKHFTRTFLNDENLSFYLCTTPPKEILTDESRLIEINCVPSALLHFGSSQATFCGPLLKMHFLEKITSNSLANSVAAQIRQQQRRITNVESSSSGSATFGSEPINSGSAVLEPLDDNSDFVDPRPSTSSGGGQQPSTNSPKWFKMNK